MKPVEVFYHIYIPSQDTANTWIWFVDQQLSLIRDSGLAASAKINLAITMPMWWSGIDGAKYQSNSIPPVYINLHEKVTEYINARYPFANILDIRDTSESNLFEAQTLRFLHKTCCESQESINVLYIHTKGMYSGCIGPNISNWREILNYYCISQWQECVKNLEHSDVVGLKDAITDERVLSGNFWWATSDHVKTLMMPTESDGVRDNEPKNRYPLEKWITDNQPRIYRIADTKTNHYTNYCFLEDLLKLEQQNIDNAI